MSSFGRGALVARMTVTESRRLTGPSLVLDRPGAVLEVALRRRGPSSGAIGRLAGRGAAAARRGRLGGRRHSRSGASPAARASRSPRRSTRSTPPSTSTRRPGPRRPRPSSTVTPRRLPTPSSSVCARPSRTSGTPPSWPCATPRARAASPSSRAKTRCRSARAPACWSGRTDDAPGAGARGLGARARHPGGARHRLQWQDHRGAAAGRDARRRAGRTVGHHLDRRGRSWATTCSPRATTPGRAAPGCCSAGRKSRRPCSRRRGAGCSAGGSRVDRAAVAVVTNIADDHLGEFGVQDRRGAGGREAAGDAARSGTAARWCSTPTTRCSARARHGARVPVVWFSLEPSRPSWCGTWPPAAARRSWWTTRWCWPRDARGRRWRGWSDMPMTLGGAARHNVANALAAAGRGGGAGRAAGRDATGDSRGSPGTRRRQRGPRQRARAGRHNPRHRLRPQSARDGGAGGDGLGAAGPPPAGAHRPGGRPRGRGDPRARASALAIRPDRIVLKEMDRYLRGRRPGEVPGLMADELARRGVPRRRGAAARAPRWRRCATRWRGPGRATCCSSPCTRTGRLVMALLEHLRTMGGGRGRRCRGGRSAPSSS